MEQALYRKEVVDQVKHSSLGTPVAPRNVQGIAAGMAVGIVIAITAWLCIGTYTRRVATRGLAMRMLSKREIQMVSGGRIMKCKPGDGQVEGTWIDRWLGTFFGSGM